MARVFLISDSKDEARFLFGSPSMSWAEVQVHPGHVSALACSVVSEAAHGNQCDIVGQNAHLALRFMGGLGSPKKRRVR